MIKKNLLILKIFFLFCATFIPFKQAQAQTKNTCYSDMSEVLECFINHKDHAYKYYLVEENNETPEVTKKTYIMHSQTWPINKHHDIPTTTWKHKLVIYLPKKISHSKALLYINGGRTNDIYGKEEFLSSKEQIDYSYIAIKNNAPVVELQDIPNQYLFFNNNPVKEDEILAYTYKKVIEDPMKNAYLAGHLPMTKAAIKAMDATQEIILKDTGKYISGFLLSGSSKRGWVTWLAAIKDQRVEAIAPIVIDILNAKNSITHTCKSHSGICPPALNDYEKYGIVKLLNSTGSTDLMRIEDPYTYLQDPKYISRLAIPKYIINASGDDFFVPDSSRWYFKSLPGSSNYIRYMPNSMHYFKGNKISDTTKSLKSINESLTSYFHFVLNKVSLPSVSWHFDKTKINIKSSKKPSAAKLWYANNEKNRDFRFINSYTKFNLLLKQISHFLFSKQMCDTCYLSQDININCKDKNTCEIQADLPKFDKGWLAAFVELDFDIGTVPFVITTEVNITPDTMPVKNNETHFELS